jgi:hypothetical protein
MAIKYKEYGIGEGIVYGYNIKSYATDPTHEMKIWRMSNFILKRLGKTPETTVLDVFMKKRAPQTPLTGTMILQASQEHDVPYFLIMALIQNDTMYGTKGIGARLKNPGNIGNDDAGHTRAYSTWYDGVEAVAKWVARHNVM